MSEMTPERVKEIRERANAATPGPWQTRFIYRTFNTVRKYARRLKLFMGPDNDWKDAEFIASSRADVPALCDALEAAWQERDALKKELIDLRLRLRLDTEAMTQATETIRGMRAQLSPVAHICGHPGFGYPGDRCLACDEAVKK